MTAYPFGLSGLVVAAVATMLFVAQPAGAATVVFEDNFNAENGGVGSINYEDFDNWTVVDGTVDLIGNGVFDFLPGNGMYVDLDGTTFETGTLRSHDLALDPGVYELSFDLAGPAAAPEGDPETGPVEVTLDSLFGAQYTRGAETDFETIVAQFPVFAPASSNLQFAQLGESNNIGMMLNNVQLSLVSEDPTSPAVVPTPSTALAGLALFSGLAMMRRRR